MIRWRRILAHLAAGLVCLMALLPLTACGPGSEPPASSLAQAQTQATPQDPIPVHAREHAQPNRAFREQIAALAESTGVGGESVLVSNARHQQLRGRDLQRR